MRLQPQLACQRTTHQVEYAKKGRTLMRLFRYFLIMVVGAAIGAGAWVAWQSITKESPSASFLERLRLPQYKPDGHSSSTRGDELLIGQGYQLPYVSLSWDIHPSSASERLTTMIGLTHT